MSVNGESHMNILLVEDNPADEFLCKEFLGESEFKDATYYSVGYLRDALNLLQSHPIDLVLLDLSLPDCHGLETFTSLNSAHPHVPKIIMTGTMDRALGIAAIHLGAQDYLVKDELNAEFLEKTIGFALERSHLVQQQVESIQQLQVYADILSRVTSIVILFDRHSSVEYVNPRVESVLGYHSSDLKGNGWWELVYPNEEERAKTKKQLDQRKATDKAKATTTFDCQLKHITGELLEFSCQVSSSADDAMVMIAHDITEREMAKRSLADTNLQLESLLYRITHDLKSPVSTTKGIVKMGKKEIGDPQALQYFDLLEETVNIQSQQLDRMEQIVAIHQRTPAQLPVEINAIVQWLNELVLENRNDVMITFTTTIEYSGWIVIDRDLLEVALTSLVINAIQYRKLGIPLELHLQVTQEGERILISLTDNGLGIPNEIQTKVFDLFFRGNDHSEGFGLGLYLADIAIRKLHGSIQLESKKGVGTSFVLALPHVQDKP